MEIFMQSGENIVMNPFEDFRIYTGVGYILNENITFFADTCGPSGKSVLGLNTVKATSFA